MRIEAGVASSAGQILAGAVANVLARSGITESFREAKVNNVNDVALITEAHQKVVGLYVAMDIVTAMNVLYAAYLFRKRIRIIAKQQLNRQNLPIDQRARGQSSA